MKQRRKLTPIQMAYSMGRRAGRADRQKCGYADKYKATRPPICGCVACETKWAAKLADEIEASGPGGTRTHDPAVMSRAL